MWWAGGGSAGAWLVIGHGDTDADSGQLRSHSHSTPVLTSLSFLLRPFLVPSKSSARWAEASLFERDGRYERSHAPRRQQRRQSQRRLVRGWWRRGGEGMRPNTDGSASKRASGVSMESLQQRRLTALICFFSLLADLHRTRIHSQHA